MSEVTLIGCGLMGSALAEALIAAGHDLHIVVRRKEPVQSLLDKGAQYFSHAGDTKKEGFTVLCLPDYNVVNNIINEMSVEDIEGRKFINTTTMTPSEAVKISKKIKSCRGKYLDAKIECYPAEVGPEQGYLVYSGDKELFDEAYDMLTAFSPEPIFISDKDAAAAVIDMAAVLNMQFAVFYSLIEGVALSLKHDCPLNDFFDMAANSVSGMVDVFRRQMMDAFENGIPEKYEDAKEASLAIEYHALESVVNSLKESGIKPHFSVNMLEIMKKSIDAGDADKDMVALMKHFLTEDK